MEIQTKPGQGKKYFIKTFGCQMNVHDSDRMAALLADTGYTEAPAMEDADLVLFNTCSVRDKSEQKAYSAMGTLKRNGTKKNGEVIIGFTGCVAQQDKEEVFQGAPHLDFVLGTDSIDQLPEVIYRVESGEKKVLQAGFDPSNDYSIETKALPGKNQAFVNIMKGCDNFCTYCIVPFTRGREKSRKLDEIVQDVKRLLLGGVVEITLLGQNVNSYGKSLGGEKSGQTFPLLLRAIQAMADDLDARGITDPTGRSAKPRGLRRLRYTTSHPKDFDEEMIACHRELSRLMPQVHLPVQAGSPRILKRMKRYVPIETYVGRLEALREAVPDVTISTDLIVGFPGETEEEFEATLDLMRRLRYDFVFAYSYSPRPGTAALKYGDTVPEEVKKDRLARLNYVQAEIQREKHKLMEGRAFEVLVEGPSKTDATRATGRTAGWRSVNFSLPNGVRTPSDLEGKFLPVKITATNAFGIAGEPALL